MYKVRRYCVPYCAGGVRSPAARHRFMYILILIQIISNIMDPYDVSSASVALVSTVWMVQSRLCRQLYKDLCCSTVRAPEAVYLLYE